MFKISNILLEVSAEDLKLLGKESKKFWEGVDMIGSDAFSKCADLQTMIIPKEIKEIRYGAFKGCKNLKYVVLPEAINHVAFDAFENCPNLKYIFTTNESKIPANLTAKVVNLAETPEKFFSLRDDVFKYKRIVRRLVKQIEMGFDRRLKESVSERESILDYYDSVFKLIDRKVKSASGEETSSKAKSSKPKKHANHRHRTNRPLRIINLKYEGRGGKE